MQIKARGLHLSLKKRLTFCYWILGIPSSFDGSTTNSELNIASSVSDGIENEQYFNVTLELETEPENDEEYPSDIPIFIESGEDNLDSDEYLFKLAASLYGSPNLTIQNAIDTMQLLKQFADRTVKNCLLKIQSCSDINDAKFVLKNHKMYNFEEYTSEYKFKQKVINRNLYREPKNRDMPWVNFISYWRH